MDTQLKRYARKLVEEQLGQSRLQLAQIADDISFVKSYTIKQALPSSTTKIKSKKNIYFCGDWMEEPSIDGALKSGRIVANKLNQI